MSERSPAPGVLGPHDPHPEAPDHDVRAVLAITPFRRLWMALGLSSLGDWLGLLATTSLAARLAGSPSASLFAVSGVFIFRLAPAVLLGPLAGVVADRLDRRWTLVIGDLARFVLFCTIPIVGTLWWLFAATVLIECVGLFWMPAKEATVPNLVPRRRLETANQLSLAVTYGSAPVAALLFSGLTLLNGVLDTAVPSLAPDPTYLALYVDALTFLVSALVIWKLAIPEGKVGHSEHESLWRTAVEGWRFIGSTPLVRGLVLGMLGAFAAGGLVIGLAQRFVADLGAGAPGYGALFAAVFLGMAAGMWLGPRLLAEFSRRRLFGLSLTCAGVALILLALIPNVVVGVLITVIIGAAGGMAWVTGYTLLGLEVGDEVRGRTFAFVQSMVRVVLISVLAIGPVVAAVFTQVLHLPHTLHITQRVALTYTGVMVTFLLAGVLAVVIGLVAYRQMDDRDVPLREDLVAALRQRHIGHPPRRQPDHPGVLVALEGGDGTGKSTQAQLLGDWLTEIGHEVVLTHEPGATEAGQHLRRILLSGGHLAPRAEALLFAADRAQHVETVVRPALRRGAVVVTDRYVDSSVAYQGTGRDLGASEVAQLSRWATQGLLPDLTVVLDLPADAARARRGGEDDRLEAEPDEFHDRVRERYLAIARRAPSRYMVVDATLPPEEVHAQVRERLETVLPESPKQRAEREAREAEERARLEAERLQREAEEKARREREEAERLQREAEEKARREREEAERRQREAEERARREREEAERQEREAARQEQEARAAAERARLEAERLQAEAEEKARRAAEAHQRSLQRAQEAYRGGEGLDSTRPMPAVSPGQVDRDGQVDGDGQVDRDGPTEHIALDEEIFNLGDGDHDR